MAENLIIAGQTKAERYDTLLPQAFALIDTETDLIAAASQVVPLSRTAREQLEDLRRWAASGRARPASNLAM